jgi:hypothetical protein
MVSLWGEESQFSEIGRQGHRVLFFGPVARFFNLAPQNSQSSAPFGSGLGQRRPFFAIRTDTLAITQIKMWKGL